MANLNVGVACIVVPDGGEAKSEGADASQTLRISVMLAPVVASGDDPFTALARAAVKMGGIHLPAWPKQIMRAMQSGEGGLRIHLRTDGGSWTSIDLADPEATRPGYEQRMGEAQSTWERAFGGGADAEYEALVKALQQDSEDRIANVAVSKEFWSTKGLQGNERVLPKFKYLNRNVSPLEIGAPATQLLADSMLWMHATDLLRTRVSTADGSPKSAARVRDESWQFAKQFRTPPMPDTALGDPAAAILKKAALGLREVNLSGLDSTQLDERRKEVDGMRARDEARKLPRITQALANFDELASGSPDHPDDVSAVQYAMAMHGQATRFERPSEMDTQSDEDNDRLNIARRRLAGLRSHPTLAKMVQMTVDVELKIDSQLQKTMGLPLEAGDWFGEICAEFVPNFKDEPRPEPAGLTVTIARASVEKGHFFFGPASRHEYNRRSTRPSSAAKFDQYQARADIPLEHGFLNMLHDPGRFRLRMFDATLGVTATGEAVMKKDQMVQQGAADEDIGIRLPTLATHGIEIIDVYSGVAAARDLARSFMLEGAPPLCFAEDLLSGFSVDVELTRNEKTLPWCPATARKLTYQGLEPKGKAAHLFPAFAHRDEGLVQAFIRELKVPDGDPKDKQSRGVFFAREELCTWTGAPMSLPIPPERQPGESVAAGRAGMFRVAQLDRARDMNIGVTYDFQPESRFSLPSLRLGYQYRFILRARYGNGGGPRFEPDRLPDMYNQMALGQSGTASGVIQRIATKDKNADKPAHFVVHDPLGAPDLLLPADDKLVTARHTDAVPGEKFNRVVLRWDGNPLHDGVRRILLPPHVAFNTAELQGQFDASREDRPSGAFLYMDLGADSGALPQAVDGKILHAPVPDPSKPVEKAGEHRGSVFLPKSRPKDIELPWYCDKRARRIIVAISRAGKVADDIALPCEDLAFWKEGEHPDKALPIVLEFRMAKPGATGARFVGKPQRRVLNIGGRFTAMHLVMEVGLAEQIEVKAWCVDDESHRHSALIRTLVDAAKNSTKSRLPLASQLASLDNIKGPGANAEVLRFLGNSHSSALGDVTQWTVTAAIRRPWFPPRFLDKKPGVPSLNFTRLKATGAQQAWEDIMRGGVTDPTPIHMPGGSIAFVRGTVAAHRRSTESLRLQLVWRDFDDSVCVQKTEKGTWVHQPRTLTEEQTMPVVLDEDIATQPVDLAAESWQSGKPVQFDVGTRAVRVALRVVAKSRFEKYFQKPEGTQPDPSRVESESHPVETLLPDNDVESDRSMWIPSTVRPPVPELGRLELIYQALEVTRTRTSVTVESRWKVRVRLAARTWHASGEDEMLAVVLSPEDLIDGSQTKPRGGRALSARELKRSPDHRRKNLLLEWPFLSRTRAASVDEDSKLQMRMKMLNLVTGWGADPATQAGKLDAVMSAAHFAGWAEKREKLPLPFKLGNPLGDVQELEALVSVIAYKPILDEATGERFVDIDMLMPEVDAPFVRLSLARYQPHSMRKETFAPAEDASPPLLTDLIDVSLSPHVLKDVGTLHSVRRATVTVSHGKVAVTVIGAAHQRRSLGLPKTVDGKTGQEFLEAHRYRTDVPWMRIRLMRLDGKGTTQIEEAEIPALINGNHGIWETQFMVTEPGDVQIFIEECRQDVSSNDATDQSKPQLVETPRGFKCDIPLSV